MKSRTKKKYNKIVNSLQTLSKSFYEVSDTLKKICEELEHLQGHIDYLKSLQIKLIEAEKVENKDE